MYFLEFSEDSWAQRLFLFQEAIVERFGFLRCTVENPRPFRGTSIHDKSASLTAHHHQYVHLTGNAFILIPSQPCQVISLKKKKTYFFSIILAIITCKRFCEKLDMILYDI